MKIAFISTEKLPIPPITGGAVQIYIDGILPYISKVHDVTVYSVKNKELKDEEIKDNVRFVRLDAQPKEIYIENLLDIIEDDFDLIHVFNRPKWVNILSNKFRDTRFGLSLHNEMFRSGKISCFEAEKCINKVQYINTVSKYIAGTITELYKEAENKVRVVYSGVDSESINVNWSVAGIETRNTLKKKYNIENYKVVLFVGRLCEKKGVDVLLKAMNKVMQRKNNVALVIVGSHWFGEDNTNSYTQKLIEISKKIKGPIIFTGFLRPEQVMEHYNMADLFVCSSQWNEPLARVHYEAMAAGVPIITTDRGGNAEVIKGYKNGIVISEYNNSSVFADKILYLLNSPAVARRMGMNGRKLAEKKFNFSRVAAQVMEGFE